MKISRFIHDVLKVIHKHTHMDTDVLILSIRMNQEVIYTC
jgi:hypothetical protein